MKQRIENFDFIRGITALLIVCYHIACMPDLVTFWAPINYRFANGDWGHITFVSIFFMISGATLLYNHPSVPVKEYKSFYFKRFKSIFPMFYLVWGYNYLNGALKSHHFFYKAPPVYLLLSLTGLDGYFTYLRENYYQVGEWFLGAIILLYVLYPLLLFCYNHFFIPACAGITALFLLNIHFNWFIISDETNLITCIFCFWLGMCFIRFMDFLHGNKWFTALCLIGSLVIIFIPLPINSVICMIGLGAALFIVSFNAADYLLKQKQIRSFSLWTSKLSYAIFLIHHVIIYYVFGYFSTVTLSHLQEFGLSVAIFIFVYIFADILNMVNNKILHSKTWSAIERKVLG